MLTILCFQRKERGLWASTGRVGTGFSGGSSRYCRLRSTRPFRRLEGAVHGGSGLPRDKASCCFASDLRR